MAQIRLSDAIDRYVATRAPELAESTVKSDRNLLTGMLSEVGNLWCRNVTAEHLSDYLNGRFDARGKCLAPGRRQALAPASFNFELGKLRVFFRWCRDEGHMAKDPTRGIRKAIVPRAIRARLEPVDLSRALDCCEHARDRIFIAMAMNLGLRAGELTALKLGMVDLDHGRIDVTIFKSTKTDTMPISASLRRELVRWLHYYEAEALDGQLSGGERKVVRHDPNCDCGRGHALLCPDWYLAPARNPHRFTDGGQVDQRRGRLRPRSRIANPQLIANTVLKAMGVKGDGLGKGEGMHTFRRGAAQAVYEAAKSTGAGRDNALEITRSFLHHSTVSTTERYLDREKSREARDDLLMSIDLFAESMDVTEGVVVPLRRDAEVG